MRPKLFALIAVSAFALTSCAVSEPGYTSEEQAYLESVKSTLEPLRESTDAVSDDELLEGGYNACEGEPAPKFKDAGHYRFAVSNVVSTSAHELCPNK